MKTIAISFIVPIYNVEKYLDRCIDSIRNQTLRNIEIILVDDESPDNCPEKCDYYSTIDSRIKVIHKKNAGLGLARNSGLEIAQGEYVYFIDSDDYIELNTAEKLYNEAKKQRADICIGGYYIEEESGKKKLIESRFTGKKLNNKEIINEVLKDMIGEPAIPPNYTPINMAVWQGIYSLEWIKKENLKFESERIYISEDTMFHLNALPKAQKMVILEGGYYHHIVDNTGSLTNRYNPERFNKVCDLYLEQRKRIIELGLDDSFIERAQSMYLGYVRACLKQIVQNIPSIGFRLGIKEIKKVVKSQILQDILNQYPYNKNRKIQRFYNVLLKCKCTILIYCTTKVFLLVRK